MSAGVGKLMVVCPFVCVCVFGDLGANKRAAQCST